MADLVDLAKRNQITDFEKEWARTNGKGYPLSSADGQAAKTDFDRYKTYNLSNTNTNTNNSTGSGSIGSTAQKSIVGLLGTQNIDQQSIGYNYSTLSPGKDTTFQLSSMTEGLFDVINKAEGSVSKMVGGLLGKGLEQVLEGVTQILGQEVELRNKINSQLGMTGELSREFRNNIIDTIPAATQMAFGFEDVSKYATSLVENTGKMTTFGKDVLIQSQATARAFYGDLRLLGDAIDGFEKAGIGAKDAIKEIDDAGKSSLTLGLNARKVVADVSANMDKLNSIGFKNGVEGLTRMVQKSIEFNISIEKVRAMADKLFEPDNAIALSAELQAIGGAIGDFNDPLKLMYMATNDAGGLQDAMIGVAGSLATYNSELGRFEITGVNLRKSKALAEQMGMSMEEMSKTAIKAAERSSAATALLSSGLQIDEKEKEFLTNISKMEGGRMVIDVPESIAKQMGLTDTKVALENLTPTRAKGLLENQKAFEGMSTEEIARDQFTTTQNIQKDVSALLALAKVNAAKELRGGLAEVDKKLEQMIGGKLKTTTSAEVKSGEGEVSSFFKEMGANANKTLKSSIEEVSGGGVSKSALQNANTNTSQTTSVSEPSKKIDVTVKSDSNMTDAMTRAMYSSPSTANDVRNGIMDEFGSYTFRPMGG